MTSTKSFRLTGITFSPGSSMTFGVTDGAIHLVNRDSSPNTSMRIDHCHLAQLYQGKLIWVSGWIYGVADHNVIDCRGNSFPFFIQNDSFFEGNGNRSWADYPWYGTNKFFFIETNTILKHNTNSAITDASLGAKYVFRYNYCVDGSIQNHGTEGGLGRGTRAQEVYGNTMQRTGPGPAWGSRSGTSLVHDNRIIGTQPSNGHFGAMSNYRTIPARAFPVWGTADGTSVWDENDTEGNYTFVEGHAPHLFESGSATSDGTQARGIGTMTDSTKSWTTNQWVGYSIRNMTCSQCGYLDTPPSDTDSMASFIISNTATTISYRYYSATDTRGHMVFKTGDQYQIHRVIHMMDGNGMGKSDLITDTNALPYNSTTGIASYAHSAKEPCYSWNNVGPSNNVIGITINTNDPVTKVNRDYFNLGNGFPANTTPAQVSSTYTAARNGVGYVGTFVYPHPLVTAQPLVAAQPTSTQCSRLQRRLDRLQRRQQRLERRHRSNPRLGKRIRRLQLRLQRQHCP
jgi:hypothetical protein